MADIDIKALCKNRKYPTFCGYDYCLHYEMSRCNGCDLSCPRYEAETEEDREEDYCPCATRGDYSPGNPWDAPGMSISDFI